MNFYISLSLLFLKFFFYELPVAAMTYFTSINRAFLQMFSLPLLVKTYFKPWKNEYRKEFVPMAIGIGMVIKTFVIIADLIIFLLLLLFEFIFILGIILWPLITVEFLLKP